MANFYDVGDSTRLAGLFYNLSSVLTDPTTVTFKLKTPDDAVTTYVYGVGAEVVKDSTGSYHVDFVCVQQGLHVYSWVGTGAVTTAEDGFFTVRGRYI